MVKDLTATVQVTVEVRVRFPTGHSGLKDLVLLQFQLRFDPWPWNFHMHGCGKKKEKKKIPTTEAWVAAEAKVRPRAKKKRKRIWHCHSCRVSHTGSDSIPGPGTSICCGHLKKKMRRSCQKDTESDLKVLSLAKFRTI